METIAFENLNTIYWYFWLFGLVNNVLYVVILSAAVDLVGPNLPKSLVLLANILPAFMIKLASPFFIHEISYPIRIFSIIIMSFSGMLLVVNSSLHVCLLGIALASVSSGFGEVTFLQLTHYYKEMSLNGWSSGTGAAGLVGSGVYLVMTSLFHVSTELSLLIYSILPLTFLFYFQLKHNEYIKHNNDTAEPVLHEEVDGSSDGNSTLINSHVDDSINIFIDPNTLEYAQTHIKDTLRKLHELILPYMLPLTSVYIFEYLINQAVSPTLLFPINELESSVILHHYRDMYVTYSMIYQFGVFISRSTAGYFRLKNLYMLSVLQFLNLLLTLAQSWFYIIRSPLPVMMLIFYEGFLGGTSYVNTFLNVLEEVNHDETEFALGSVSIADSLGILIAAFIGLRLEPTLCKHQINDGRPWCGMQ